MALEEAFNVPRSRCQTDHVMLHVLPAAAKTLGVIGFKAYSTSQGRGADSTSRIYDGKTGEMLALMQADYLGQVRTGAASAVATKHLCAQGRRDGRHLRCRQAGPNAAPRRVARCAS